MEGASREEDPLEEARLGPEEALGGVVGGAVLLGAGLEGAFLSEKGADLEGDLGVLA